MSVARHHHYIPRFYLAGFTPSGQKDDHLSVLDLDQRKQWKSSTRDAGAARDFNRVDIPGMRIDAVEKALSPFESEVSSVLESLKTERNFTSEAELHLILEFVALLAVRNTLLRETMENVQEEMIWFVLQQMLASPERWKEQKESLRDQGFPLLPDLSLAEARKRFEEGNLRYEPSNTDHVLREIGSVSSATDHLLQRKWILFDAAESDGRFVCSDRPIACHWSVPMPPGMRPPGLAEKDSVVSVPLSKEFALYGVYDGRSGVAPATKAVIGEINTHTIDAADRFVYSPKSDFLCRGQDGSARKARDVLLDPPGVNLSNLGKVLVFFTDEGKHWIKVRSYERDNENPVAPTVRFWTDDLETLHLLADCGHVDVLYFFDGGQERGGVRDLKFDSVAITQGTPTILKAHW